MDRGRDRKIQRYQGIRKTLIRAQIVLVMLDATELVTDQDARIAGFADERGKAIVIILNKWDLVAKDSKTHGAYLEKVRTALKYLDHAPILTISATEGTRAVKIFPVIDELYQQYNKRIGTSPLNDFLETVKEAIRPGRTRKQEDKDLLYDPSEDRTPDLRLLFATTQESIHFSYQRFPITSCAKRSVSGGSPLRLYFRRRESHKGADSRGRSSRR